MKCALSLKLSATEKNVIPVQIVPVISALYLYAKTMLQQRSHRHQSLCHRSDEEHRQDHPEMVSEGLHCKDMDQHSDFGTDFQTGCYFAVTQSMKPGKGSEFTVNGKASTEIRFTHPVIRTKDVGSSGLYLSGACILFSCFWNISVLS